MKALKSLIILKVLSQKISKYHVGKFAQRNKTVGR